MLSFHSITIKDKPVYDAALNAENTSNSSLSFGVSYLWNDYCNHKMAVIQDRVVIEYTCYRHTPLFLFPFGKGDLSESMQILKEEADRNRFPLSFCYLDDRQKNDLESLYPGSFRFTSTLDDSDYLYSIDSLCTLSGKKLHRKKSHCNKFEAEHSWHYEALTPEHFKACEKVISDWMKAAENINRDEITAIRRAFHHWDELGMNGGILFADGSPVAFSFGELISKNVFNCHFEKAVPGIDGAYPMICRELSRNIHGLYPEVTVINREEDMGLPSLRKAKNEWFPISMVTKYTAVLTGDNL